MAKEKLQIIPLGGLGEIGKNMTVFRYGDDIVVLDSGLAFPDNEMLGIDIVIPDFSYLIENKDKVRAIVITHGHEDHIGSLSYLLKEVSAPVYATRLTCGLIEGKLKENRVGKYQLNVVKSGDEITAGVFKVGFFHVNHSIPDSCGIYFRTPVGTVVHSGDFKIDYTPVDGKMMDFKKITELGNRGVLVYCADSTNAERAGHTPSEKTVSAALMREFAQARGRIILATFASNVSRLQMAIDAAVANQRKVAVFGRSMVNVVGIALEIGYLTAPKGTIIDSDEINRYRADQLCILTTGSQGEPMAGLSRMADGAHRQIQIHPNDTVILSASPIPGNETSVGRTIDKLVKLGAHVVHGSDKKVHVSGHGSQEELKMMLSLIRPRFFIPMHGEYRMLHKHAEIAESLGVKRDNILIGENGQIFEFTGRKGRLADKVQAGKVYVDGLGVGDVGNIVIRDRQQLSQDGMVIVTMVLEKGSAQVLAGPDIVSRGFIYMRDSEALIREMTRRVDAVIERCADNNITEWNVIKTQIRDTLSRYIFEKTRRRPMILPIIQEVH